MSSPSPRSRARSTSTCTTSRASKRWRARRARCTAPARSRAPSASSPTSLTSRASMAASASRATRSPMATWVISPKASPTFRSATSAAIRLVGWVRHDGGYIDNVAATRTFPTSGISQTSLAKDNYNDADTYGARAALKIDLNDNWSITPSVMFQKQKGNGVYAGESDIGDLEVAHWHPENTDDQWAQAALTVEGKISNLDITFASSYLKRDVDVNSDYSDYSFFYDTLVRLRHVLHRQRRRAHQSLAVHPGQGRLHQDQQRAALLDVGGKPLALRRRPVRAAPDARHPAGVPHHRAGRRRRRDRLGRYVLAHQAVARGPRRGDLRRSHFRRHRQVVVHRRRALFRNGEFARRVLRLRHQQSVRLEHRRSILLRYRRRSSKPRPAPISTRP